MAADPTKTATDTAGKLGNNPVGGALAPKDPAKGDVTGGRKPGQAEGDDADGPPVVTEEKKNSLRINIQLDLDVEVHLTARIKGDITIGLL